jgi:O-acetylhomoserine/O-acetylserine sulfhydrylase-like pyridoxal-dependent enzyme
MAVIQISRIQHRRGLQADLPNLASAELGWSVDTRQLYIGNGTTEEGAPSLGKTEILTQYSILDFKTAINANLTAVQGQIVLVNSNVSALATRVTNLEAGALAATAASLSAGAVAATVTTITANNAIITYTMGQGSAERTGTITASRAGGTVSFAEEYTETAATDIVFTMNANVTTANLNYSSTTSANLFYRISTF